ncbi:MAG TPA: urease accessory protein UreD [Vicinamibacterales bacterium]|jgi:urease accessory protein|nr:urease accessory protein UreD [Vicinamibacterales bacterium]
MAHGSGLTAQGGLDMRPASAVGRAARLELRFCERDGRTVMAGAYAEPPFRVGRTFPEGNGVHMIMAWSAPGIFGGDAFEQVIRVEAGARVRLTSQSALQVHPSSEGGVATLRSRYIVDEGGELSCFWDPLIPFAHSRLDQRCEIELAPGARLSWSDAFMAGREARGERWQFASLAHELRVVRGGRLDYLERFTITEPRDQPWVGGRASYFGSTIVSHPAATAAAAEAAHRRLVGLTDAVAACDLIARELLLVRLMSPSGPAFHAARGVSLGGA